MLGEFQDREIFPRIIEFASLSSKVLDYLIGDMVTSGLKNDLMDEMCLGKYDSCVDYMFEYRDNVENFCDSSMETADTLRHWAMFEREPVEDGNQMGADFEKLLKMDMKNAMKQEPSHKVGRNDPCPCGSGRNISFAV